MSIFHSLSSKSTALCSGGYPPTTSSHTQNWLETMAWMEWKALCVAKCGKFITYTVEIIMNVHLIL